MGGNVLYLTLDQWRGDSLSALGHPIVETPTLDRIASQGTLFANHWANTAPCGPSRACLHTGTYLHMHRSVQNGTPLDARFTNIALLAREAGYKPALFGYTDTTVDPRTVDSDDPRLRTYEGVLPGFDPVLVDYYERGSPEWGKWLAAQGVDVPANPHDLYLPVENFPGATAHGATWAPARFSATQSQTAFLVGELIKWIDEHGDEPFFVHAAFIRPHPPYRNPPGYHDLYAAEAVAPFQGFATRAQQAEAHPLNNLVLNIPGLAAPVDERDRRQLRATYYGAQREVDDALCRLFDHLETTGLADDTMVVITSDHGEMGGDYWLTEKLGYWDESYHVPLIVKDPRNSAKSGRGRVVRHVTESVDVLPTICDWMGVEVPLQADGYTLGPFIEGGVPEHWRSAAHWEWDFSYPQFGLAKALFGIPSAHCSLAVSRSETTKIVQFAADADVFPSLLFDLVEDPGQLDNRATSTAGADRDHLLAATQDLLRWRMRNEERTLSGHVVSPEDGLRSFRDDWR